MSREDHGVEARREFAALPANGELDGVELSALDPEDDDDRALLIRAEHPEFVLAIESGVEEIEIDGQVLNPRLHLAIHEIVAKQLWQNDPPEVWQTALRLRDAGYERHETLHMLGSAVASSIWVALNTDDPRGRDAYLVALAQLPVSWEQQRRSE